MQNSVPVVESTVQNAEQPAAATSNVFLRNDTILGVCEAIGEDFGFHANWLRVPLAALVIFSPFAALGLYAVLAVAVLAARLLFPTRRQLAASSAERAPESRTADNQTQEELLAA